MYERIILHNKAKYVHSLSAQSIIRDSDEVQENDIEDVADRLLIEEEEENVLRNNVPIVDDPYNTVVREYKVLNDLLLEGDIMIVDAGAAVHTTMKDAQNMFSIAKLLCDYDQMRK